MAMRFALVTLVFTLLLLQAEAQKPLLIPYRAGKLWGYSDRSGILVLPPRWTSAGFFRNGKARVSTTLNRRQCWAIINTQGNYLLPPERYWSGEWHGFRGTRLNYYDESAYMGMIDTSNQVLIPPLYKDLGRPFQWRDAWRTTFLETIVDGKRGIIDTQGRALLPFEYESLSYLETTDGDPWRLRSTDFFGNETPKEPIYDSSMMAPIIAVKDGQYGLVTIQNKVLVPFGMYDRLMFQAPCWIFCVKESRMGVLNVQGKLQIPSRDGNLAPIGRNWFSVQRPQATGGQAHVGLIDDHGNTVLPFRYTSISADAQSVTLSIADSIPPPEIQRKTKDGAIALGSYNRHLDLHTLRPLDNWTYKERELFRTNRNWCGTAASGWANMRNHYASLPVVVRNDSALRSFEQDKIQWSTVAVAGSGFVALSGRHNDTRVEYTAIVDKNLRYCVRPTPGNNKLIYYNRQAGLILCYRQGGSHYNERVYSVLDTNMQPLMKDIAACLTMPFRWKGKLYVLASMNGCYSEPEVDPINYRGGFPRLLDSTGQAVAALSVYHILYPSKRDGTQADNFEGYFFALDSFGRPGIVDITGRTLYPAVSFRYMTGQTRSRREDFHFSAYAPGAHKDDQAAWLLPLGNGWFLHEHRWVDTNDKDLMPGAKVLRLEPAWYEPVHTAGYVFPRQKVPGVFILDYETEKGRQNCYVTDNGVVHADRLHD